METREAILRRRSCRNFDAEKPIADTTIRSILESGLRAPSAGNGQPWKIYVVKNPEMKTRLMEAAGGSFFIATAPVVLAVCIDEIRAASAYGRRGLELYAIQDTAALIENILLEAVDQGLDTCWVGAFDESYCEKILSLPEGLRPVALVPLGYAADKPIITSRRTLEEVVVWL